MRIVEKSEIASNITVLYYTVETNHVHFIIAFDDVKKLSNFFQRLNTGFGKAIRNLNGPEDRPMVTNTKKIFSTGPRVNPQYSYAQFVETVCYQYNNPQTMRQMDPEEREYYKSSAIKYSYGRLTPENDPLLNCLNMSWPELQALSKLPLAERRKRILELSKSINPKWEKAVFK